MTGEKNGSDYDCTEHEKISLRDDDQEDQKEESRSKTVSLDDQHQSFLNEVRLDKVTRFKVILSVCVAFAHAMLGWNKGLAGPTFLDIQYISGTDLEKGSAFVTSYFTGRVIGALTGGMLYSKVNQFLILVVVMSINSATLVLIPWCGMYEFMVAAHLILGFCNGVMAVVLTAIAASIWGPSARGRVYINIFLAALSLAGLLSPMVASPFLLSSDVASSIAQRNSPENNFTRDGFFSEVNNISQSNFTQIERPASKVFIAYSISAGLAALSTLPFAVIYFKRSNDGEKNTVDKESKFVGNMPFYIKYLQLLNIGISALFYLSLNFNFFGYLATFCVKHLGWTKASGAWLTSLSFLGMLCGRVLGAYLSHFLKPMKMLVLSTLSYWIGLVGLSICGVVLFDIGIWISVCIICIPLGFTWPSLLSWTNENLISLRGNVTAFLLLMGFIGSLSFPFLFGYMMEEVSPVWFCFINLGKGTVIIFNVIIMFVYERFLRKSCKHEKNEGIDC